MTLTLNQCASLILSNSTPGEILNDVFTGDNNDLLSDYILDVNYNCCLDKKYAIRVLFDFGVTKSGCGTQLIGTTTYNYFDITLTGILPSRVSSFTYTNYAPNTPYTELFPEDLTFRLYFVNADIQVGNLLPFSITVVSLNGVTYEITGQMEDVLVGQICDDSYITLLTTTYEDISPEIIVESAGPTYEFQFEGGVFNQPAPANTLLPGVYCVTLKGVNELGVPLLDEELYSFSATYFVDCENSIKCRIAQLAATCDSVEAIWIYEALTHNNSCQVLTCTDVCNLYRKLQSFMDNNCSQPAKPCNCG